MRIVDLFSGCGGMSLGFQNAGFKVVAAFDNWEPAVSTYKKNFNHPIYQIDISDEETHKLIEQYLPDIIIGGPPCQDFSHAGKRDENLGRADLTVVFAKIVAKIHPRYFVMENVDRALKSKRYAEAKKILLDAGYTLNEEILDASLCGVPQKRKRLFLVGSLFKDHSSFARFIEENKATQPLTVRQYFDQEKIPLCFDHYYRHPRNYNRRAVYSVDEPSATVRGVNRPVATNYPGHPGDAAPLSKKIGPLTTLQRSYIQTFPEEFVFVGNKTEQEQQIGNAVPVRLAEYVAKQLKKLIASDSSDVRKSTRLVVNSTVSELTTNQR